MAVKAEFENLALPHLDTLFRAAMAMCGQESKAEDLVQLTLLKALERFDSFQPGTNCKAWLLQILRNTWIDELRHRKIVGTTVTIEEDLLAAPPEEPAPAVWSDARDILEQFSDQQVIRALNELPADQRLTLLLVDVEQLGHEDVAAIMAVAPGTVKSRCSRARAALKHKLLAYAKEHGLVNRG